MQVIRSAAEAHSAPRLEPAQARGRNGLRVIGRILWRRRWIVLLVTAIAAVAAVLLALRQAPQYRASADVLVRYPSLAPAVAGLTEPGQASRPTGTQLQIALLPELRDRVAADLRKRAVASPPQMSAASVPDSSFIRFTARSGSPSLAALAATTYARRFIAYSQSLYGRSLSRTIADLERRLADVGPAGTAQAAQLQSQVDELRTLLSLEASNAALVHTASSPTKVRPHAMRYGLIGLGLGLVAGIGLALLRNAFDTRLRSPDEAGEWLDLPLLARIPDPPRAVARGRKLVMLAEPRSTHSEAFRRLRMNLEFATIGRPSQAIMVASALEGEGTSTTAGNLGVAMALAGKRVALVDLNMRKPALSVLFDLDDAQPGVSGVVLGHAQLDAALVRIPLEAQSALVRIDGPVEAALAASGRAAAGSLVVLPSGALPPDPGEFVALDGVKRIVRALCERVDVVLLDVPPLLPVGDGLAVARLADAILVVVRRDVSRRAAITELARNLAGVPAASIGFVFCGARDVAGLSFEYRYAAAEYARQQSAA